MPLPLSGRGRGIRHRSAASGPSALSAASAGSAPRRSASSARSAASPAPAPRSSRKSAASERSSQPAAPAGQRPNGPGTTSPATNRPAANSTGVNGTDRASFGVGAFDDVDTAASSRTVHGTSTTGRKVAGMSLPGLVLVLLVVVAIIAAVLGGLGMLPFTAADPGAGAGGEAGAGAWAALSGVDMAHLWAGDTTSTTTMVGSVGVGHGTRTGVE